MLSNTCKYGLRALVYLAIEGDENKKIGIKKISEDLEIPTPFLGKILQLLAKQKVIDSTKGPHGGFGLNKKTKDIPLIDVIEIIDGRDFFESCVLGLRDCKNKNKKDICSVHIKYNDIRDKSLEIFKNESIGSFATDICKTEEGFLI